MLDPAVLRLVMLTDGRGDPVRVEEIVAAKVTAVHDEKWGKGFLPPARFAVLVARDFLKNR